jgi:hypothetical protein
MKKWFLAIAILALLASPSFAYVQSGHLLQGSAKGGTVDQSIIRKNPWSEGGSGNSGGGRIGSPAPEPIFEPLGEPVTRPIPEPGTMALASLGLLALGVSRARRRGN